MNYSDDSFAHAGVLCQLHKETSGTGIWCFPEVLSTCFVLCLHNTIISTSFTSGDGDNGCDVT